MFSEPRLSVFVCVCVSECVCVCVRACLSVSICCIYLGLHCFGSTTPFIHGRRLGVEFGGTGKLLRGLNFRMTFFKEKISILTPKISDDL